MQNSNKTQNLFDNIAKRYDFFNNVISFGLHIPVKYLSISNLNLFQGAKILDLCTGTGDLAYIIKQLCPNADVIGVDFSENMLNIAKKRLPDTEFIKADAAALPFENNSFNTAVMGFGLRNIENRVSAVKEIYRILKPNGEFMHLDFGKGLALPDKIFNIFTPALVKLFFGQKIPYEKLIESKKEFPAPDELIKFFEDFGFELKCRKDYIFGVISVQILHKK